MNKNIWFAIGLSPVFLCFVFLAVGQIFLFISTLAFMGVMSIAFGIISEEREECE